MTSAPDERVAGRNTRESGRDLGLASLGAAILMMFRFADSELRVGIDNTPVKISSFDKRDAIADIVAGVHDADSDAAVL